MSDFLPAFNRTMGFEGMTLENVPGDAGGLTFCGIAQNKNPQWPGWATVEVIVKNAPNFQSAKTACLANQQLISEVQDFYEEQIWAANLLGNLNYQELANQIYDAIVNLGASRPVKWIQMLVNTVEDGVMGPQTVAACNNDQDPPQLVLSFLGMRKACYQQIVANNPSQSIFLKGWLNRCVVSA